jgi:LysR family glycine cleavage system transcriptional activator
MTYLLPSLNALRAFEAAARHLSFKQAAHELHVTAGAISQQVRQLEERLGVQLFERLTRQVILTRAGEAYLSGVSSHCRSDQRAQARGHHQPAAYWGAWRCRRR